MATKLLGLYANLAQWQPHKVQYDPLVWNKDFTLNFISVLRVVSGYSCGLSLMWEDLVRREVRSYSVVIHAQLHVWSCTNQVSAAQDIRYIELYFHTWILFLLSLPALNKAQLIKGLKHHPNRALMSKLLDLMSTLFRSFHFYFDRIFTSEDRQTAIFEEVAPVVHVFRPTVAYRKLSSITSIKYCCI